MEDCKKPGRSPRVLGSTLGKYIGEQISIFGLVTDVGSDRKSLQITTADKVKVNVFLKQPFTHPAEGAVDIFGVAKSKTTIEGHFCAYWEPDSLKELDLDDYKEFMELNDGVLGDTYMVLPELKKHGNQSHME